MWAENDLLQGIKLVTSDSEYSNDELILEWLKYFDQHSYKAQKGAYRLELLDGYGSHPIYELWQYAQKHKIYFVQIVSSLHSLDAAIGYGCFSTIEALSC